MRIGIIIFKHESNTFLPQRTRLADFEHDVLTTGSAIIARYQKTHHEAAGLLEGTSREGMDAVPIFAASATPGATIDQATYERLRGMLLEELAKAGPLDGLLISAHGAAVAENAVDMDGQWLMAVRNAVGPNLPIISTIDPHANLSPTMVAATTALLPYRTNPHVDQKERGLEAASLMARTLRGEIRPVQAAAFSTVAINIACQNTSMQPCRMLLDLAADQMGQTKVLSSGVVLGFPYADVPEMGSSFVAVTDNDEKLARTSANELANYLRKHRHDFVPQLPDIEAAIMLAEQSPPPVCLLDLGDNVGGGSPGDGTLIAHALLQRRIQKALLCLCDAQAAKQAREAGNGATVELVIGGKTDQLHGQPLSLRAKVLAVHDGQFTEPAVRHSGKREYDMGPTAVIEAAGLTIVLHSIRTPPFSLNQLISCGLDPANYRIIVAKGVHAPLAAYAPVCRTFIHIDTPGVTTANMTKLSFQHRRRPLFPFEETGV